jgi:signal transduction histidine kinase
MNLSLRPFLPRMGLKLKILLTLSLILLGFAVTSGIAFHLIQRQELKNHLRQQGEIMATMLSGALHSALFFEDRAGMEEAVQTFLSLKVHEDLEAVMVYDANDGILLRQILTLTHSHPPAAAPMAAALKFFHLNPDQGKIWENDDLLIFTAPVSVAAGRKDRESLFFDTGDDQGQPRTVIGHAQLAICKGQFNKAVTRTALQTSSLTLLFWLISLAATYMLTRETMAPLKRLIETIRARSGQTEAEPDEVGLLGDTFSHLMNDLEKAFVTIQTLKDGLEETVAERTGELSRALDELRETNMQLAQAEKMAAIGRLVAGVAHEINNTTNFVSGALPPLRKRLNELESLLRGPEGEPPDRDQCEAVFQRLRLLLENISEGARRTNKIVGDLKNFSRPEDELPGPVDINQCLRTTCSLVYPEYKHRIRLNLELAEDLPVVEGVSGQLNQVFMNLLLNAVQAQPETGTILIRTWAADDQAHILFHDNGPGIPPAIIDKIFEPFFTTKGIGKGTGLGLSISYGIIRKHQGKILVRSEPGHGAELEIILPLRRQPLSPITIKEPS